MGVVRQQYSFEFKQEAVLLITKERLSVAQTSRDLGVAQSVLRRWKKELNQHGVKAFPGHGQPIVAELAASVARTRCSSENGIFSSRRLFFRPTSSRHLRELAGQTAICYQFVLSHQEQFSIEEMCGVLRVSRSGFYRFKACPVSQHRRQDNTLKVKIESVFKENERRYGSSVPLERQPAHPP